GTRASRARSRPPAAGRLLTTIRIRASRRCSPTARKIAPRFEPRPEIRIASSTMCVPSPHSLRVKPRSLVALRPFTGKRFRTCPERNLYLTNGDARQVRQLDPGADRALVAVDHLDRDRRTPTQAL